MTHATLFSGIGAAEIAAQSLGWSNVFNCDNNQFSQRVLKYHFPNATQYGFNIQAANFTIWRNRVDVLTGGFPCQPFSQAGKRLGTDDERYLWDEFLRVIGEVQPRWVVGENVLGIVSWSKGLVFEQVCSDLETAGYQVTPYILPAAGVGAPHQRYRVFFVAYRADAGTQAVRQERKDGVRGFGNAADCESLRRNTRSTTSDRQEDSQTKRTSVCECLDRPCEVRTTAHTDAGQRIEQNEEVQARRSTTSDGCEDDADTSSHRPQAWYEVRTSGERVKLNGFDRFPTQSPVCRRDDGLCSGLDTTTILDGKRLTRAKWREESIKAYGNAIVPQVLLQIYKAIEAYEITNQKTLFDK